MSSAVGPYLGKVPPHNEEAELSVLGGILLHNSKLDLVTDILRPEDFYSSNHEEVYRAFLALDAIRRPIDIISLGEVLRDRGELERVGGLQFISALIDHVPTAANIEAHAKIVSSLAMRRATIGVCLEGLKDAYDGEQEGPELVAQVGRRLDEVGVGKTESTMIDMSTGMKATIAKVETEIRSTEPLTGITTGFTDVDGYLSGMQRQDLILLAGRPSMGKTAMAVNIMVAAAKDAVRRAKGGKPEAVVMFSLEMSADRLRRRMIAVEGQIPAWMLMNPKHLRGENAQAKLIDVTGRLASLPIYIDDGRHIGVREVRARSRHLARKQKLCLVVIDYLQIMKAEESNKRRETNRTVELADMTGGLRALAKELDCPVLLLSQLSRATETRADKRPQLADLRESGAIEQDADVVMMLHREHYYDTNKPKDVAEDIIRKNRNGSVGTVLLGWDDYLTRFRDSPAVAAKKNTEEQRTLDPWDPEKDPEDGLPF